MGLESESRGYTHQSDTSGENLENRLAEPLKGQKLAGQEGRFAPAWTDDTQPRIAGVLGSAKKHFGLSVAHQRG